MNIGESIVTGLGAVFTSVAMLGHILKGQNKRIEALEEDCMMDSVHEVICENASLRINAHITEELILVKAELVTLKDEIFEELRKQHK